MQLSDVAPFENPKVDLEQVPTSAHIASRMLFTAANTYSDIEGSLVGDFGSGTGMLSIGCALLGAMHVVGVELDTEAIETAWVNVRTHELEAELDLIQADVSAFSMHNGKCYF